MSAIMRSMSLPSTRTMASSRAIGSTYKGANLDLPRERNTLTLAVRLQTEANPSTMVQTDVNVAPPKKQGCIFEKIGGRDAMAAAVDRFYNKVIADDRVNHFFKNTDMNTQRAKQMKFMMFAFGGPNEYKGRNMYAAHDKLNLTEEHFNVILEHFGSTLDELNIPKEVQEEVVQVVLGTKPDILGH